MNTQAVNSPLFRAGEWGIVSGITGRNGETLVPGGFEAEFECILNRLAELLGEHSLTVNDVAKVNLYLTDMNDRPRMNEMYLAFFGSHLPARTVVGVKEIVRSAAVELEAWLYLPRQARQA
jgi:2-iminobutanoate/2-iminopropanoate deaminase